MSGSLAIRNRQRAIRIDTRELRRVTSHLLRNSLQLRSFDLAIHIVNTVEITNLNETFLRHIGATDVITFDYADNAGQPSTLPRLSIERIRDTPEPRPALRGELFICVDEAISQARRFRTIWQSELVRYIIHGVLHLNGYDDKSASARRVMKREEDRLVRDLARRFRLRNLARAPKLAP